MPIAIGTSRLYHWVASAQMLTIRSEPSGGFVRRGRGRYEGRNRVSCPERSDTRLPSLLLGPSSDAVSSLTVEEDLCSRTLGEIAQKRRALRLLAALSIRTRVELGPVVPSRAALLEAPLHGPAPGPPVSNPLAIGSGRGSG